MRVSALLVPAFLAAAGFLAAEDMRLEFEPKVGTIGSKVVVRALLPEGAQVRFGARLVTVFREGATFTFLVPSTATTSFIEVVKGGRIVGKSAVPFVVSGTSLVSAPKLIGLKEAIEVFGYSEPVPQGGEKPESPAHPILKLDEDDILTVGEPPPPRLGPAVELGDAASAATRGMGPPGLLITARPPKKKLTLPPAPTPTPLPAD